MKKVLIWLSIILGIFLTIVLYENYVPHPRTETKYILNDTCIKDTIQVDSISTDSI